MLDLSIQRVHSERPIKQMVPQERILLAVDNTLSIPVTTPNVSVTKTANVTDTSLGETITYTSVITNNGLSTLQNIVFTDASPAGTSFVAGSFTIEGVVRPNANPANKLHIISIN